MPYTKILPDVDIPTNTPRKNLFFLGVFVGISTSGSIFVYGILRILLL